MHDTPSKLSNDSEMMWTSVACRRVETSKYSINMFDCTQISNNWESQLETWGIHQDLLGRKMEPHGKQRYAKCCTVMGLHCAYSSCALSGSLSSLFAGCKTCKCIVWTNRHSSCQPLRLGLVWIAIEFELISFHCCSNWQIGCWAAFEAQAKYISLKI